MKRIYLIFILMLQLVLTTKSFGDKAQYYSQYCPPNLASLSAGGISIVKPIQSGGYFWNNNPASLTQINGSHFFGDGGEASRNPNPTLSKSLLLEDEIDDSPKQNKLYGYSYGVLGYMASPNANDQDISNDKLLFQSLKRKNTYLTIAVCPASEVYLYDIKRKNDNDNVHEGYSTSYNKIFNNITTLYIALGYKEYIPGLDLGLGVAYMNSKVQSKYNFGFKEGSYGREDNFGSRSDEIGTENIANSIGIAIGANYSLYNMPSLSFGAVTRIYNTFTAAKKLYTALPLVEIGGGAAWSYIYSRYEWINSAEVINITAKSDKTYNWFEDHLGSELKINFNNIKLFTNMRLRAGLNRAYPSAGIEFNLIEFITGSYSLGNMYYGATIGKQNVGIGSIKVVNNFSNLYLGFTINK